MSHKNRQRRQHRELERKPLKEYSVQATPFTIRDLGWKFLTDLAEGVYPKFQAVDFRPLVFRVDGTTVMDAKGKDEPVMVFFAQLKEFTDAVDDERVLMIVPYLDTEGIKVLYFKWAEETIYDSFSVPDGQNRSWNNQEKR